MALPESDIDPFDIELLPIVLLEEPLLELPIVDDESCAEPVEPDIPELLDGVDVPLPAPVEVVDPVFIVELPFDDPSLEWAQPTAKAPTATDKAASAARPRLRFMIRPSIQSPRWRQCNGGNGCARAARPPPLSENRSRRRGPRAVLRFSELPRRVA